MISIGAAGAKAIPGGVDFTKAQRTPDGRLCVIKVTPDGRLCVVKVTPDGRLCVIKVTLDGRLCVVKVTTNADFVLSR